ncbi:TPA: AraC family transcriptional regulator [Pseudomonas aeruginosa]|uniref:AraC family transcriptional regulator n=1 Tax=Pseudomonas aeruginosa TaxID=287 RepID=UPI003982C4CA|nr:AraC family transcriptional regulator [Pseudomonas aeruginosa]HBP1309454.1 AraC family transcriptional regulator [Pseudomonas aeruginosa]HCF6352976.1 AraC family transcriptional regulator [Pseudomonas aeruginosa]
MQSQPDSSSFISFTDPLVPVGLPALLMEVLLEQGLTGEQLLQGMELHLEHFSHPETRFSYQQLAIIISRALAITGNPRLGLLFGSKIRFSHLSELGILYASAPTLRHAYEIGLKHQKLLGSAFDMRLVERPRHLAIIASKLVPLEERYFFNQESWLMAIANQTALSMERSVAELGLEIEFDYPAPDDLHLYHELFGEKVRFGQEYCQVLIPRSLLDLRLPGACPTMFKVAVQRCEEASSRNRAQLSLPAQVRIHLRKELQNPPSADNIARRLNLSTRTLNRRLDELDCNYRQLLREVRFETAAQLLQGTALPIAIIAQRVGFNDSSNFVKAFREWAGTTPNRYRKHIRSAAE